MTGTTELAKRAAALQRARQRVTEATEAVRAAVVEAVAGGMSEVEAARQAGVTRMTVRAWLGKR